MVEGTASLLLCLMDQNQQKLVITCVHGHAFCCPILPLRVANRWQRWKPVKWPFKSC
jgi:hypothetical protein